MAPANSNVGINIITEGGDNAKSQFDKAAKGDQALRKSAEESARALKDQAAAADKAGKASEQLAEKERRAQERRERQEAQRVARQKAQADRVAREETVRQQRADAESHRRANVHKMNDERTLVERETARKKLQRQRETSERQQIREDYARREAARQRDEAASVAEMDRRRRIQSGFQKAQMAAELQRGRYQRKASSETKATRDETERLNQSGRRAWGTLAGGAARYLATLAGGMSVMMGARRAVESAAQALARQREFEREITPLASLGGNVTNLPGLRRGVVGKSVAWGMPTAEVASAQFYVESGTPNLSKAEQKALTRGGLSTAKFTGSPSDIVTQAGIKAYQIFGPGQLGSVEATYGKLTTAAELGFMDMTDLAELFADVGNAANTVGIKADEALAAVSTGTLKGGKTQKTFTGIRNLFLRMEGTAREKGYTFTGSLEDRLRQIQAMSPEEKIDAFGEEAVAVVQALASSLDTYREHLKTIRGTVSNVAEGKLALKMLDPVSRYTERRASIEQSMINAPLSEGRGAGLRGFDERWQLMMRGYKDSTPSAMHWLAPVAAGVEVATRLLTAQGAGGTYEKRGRSAVFKEMMAGGREDLAASLYLGQGESDQLFRNAAVANNVNPETGATLGPATTQLAGTMAEQTRAVRANTAALRGKPEGSFASGIDFVPRDMTAQIHRGEAVLPAGEAEVYRGQRGVAVYPGKAAHDAIPERNLIMQFVRAGMTPEAAVKAAKDIRERASTDTGGEDEGASQDSGYVRSDDAFRPHYGPGQNAALHSRNPGQRLLMNTVGTGKVHTRRVQTHRTQTKPVTTTPVWGSEGVNRGAPAGPVIGGANVSTGQNANYSAWQGGGGGPYTMMDGGSRQPVFKEGPEMLRYLAEIAGNTRKRPEEGKRETREKSVKPVSMGTVRSE